MGEEQHPAGIALPLRGEGRSTSEFAKAVLADSVRKYDADLSQDIESSHKWDSEYLHAFRSITAVSASSAKASRGIATEGLRSAHALLRYCDDGTESALDAGQWRSAADSLETVTVEGGGTPVTSLQVPYDGVFLEGDGLRRKLVDWRDRGIMEPSFVSAVEAVIDNPKWLALPGYQAVLVGAGAETGPFQPLVTWGASVLALEQPGDRWDRLLRGAEAGASTVTYAVGDDGPGVDLTTEFPQALQWIYANTTKRRKLVFGTYADADDAADLALTAAADVLAHDILETRPDTTLSYLATPTDCFAVKADVIAEARGRWRDRGLSGHVQNALRFASRSALFRPNYLDEIIDRSGTHWSVANGLVAVQGPEYALSKRLQRWRGVVTRAAGQSVSFNVAPASWTEAVTRSRVLAGAYHGASHFGVEIFEPETARALMAAKLVSDLFAPVEVRKRANPEELFYEGAVHGGLWRQPFDPVSVLGVAAASGYPKALMG
ncbi:hypothetical protein [Antrihabitans cavernicola]|uniref:Uncharacterized protein n=1 Tax=Antrihabitans cavernicola TaxID=2495913 RepID=A0A5A7SAY7_9NOCA|nr:hypothetical protein [Spelaeibacter cavernicola]KAA0022322.1 hypothetical protein FOY51_15230 [Spelaeibacter cavernicola]